MPSNARIEQFAKQVLGCACPDEVFEHIDYQKVVGDIELRKITIGDRLLIYLVDFDAVPSPERLVETILRDGTAERNERGFNRLRLVLLTADPESSDDTWQAMLRASPDSDDKVHLHMVDVEQAMGL